MPIIIRPARASEQQVIRTIVREVRINPMQLHWQRFLIAEDDQRVVGTGQVKLHRDGSRELASIAVLPAYRHHGIASAIVRALLAREAGVLYLTCRASLESFYERFGFQRATRDELPAYWRRLYPFLRLWNGIVMKRDDARL